MPADPKLKHGENEILNFDTLSGVGGLFRSNLSDHLGGLMKLNSRWNCSSVLLRRPDLKHPPTAVGGIFE